MVVRYTLKCLTCGHRSITRTAVGQSDYQEFAFPCPSCGVEIRYGMNLLLRKRKKHSVEKRRKHPFKKEMARIAKQGNIKYVNLVNAKHCNDAREATELATVDGQALIPIGNPHFSPFMANIQLVRDWPTFARDQSIRANAVTEFMP